MSKKNVLFICSYTKKSGRGHLIRCLKLAKNLKKKNFDFFFLDIKGNINFKSIKYIKIENLDKNIIFKYIVIDHYNFNYNDIKKLNLKSKYIYFDDNNRKKFYRPYLIINGSPSADKKNYKFLENKTKLLLGPSYQILNIQKIKIDKTRNYLLLCFGYVDEKNLIPKFIRWIKKVGYNKKVLILVSNKSKNYNTIIRLANEGKYYKVKNNLKNMDQIYAKSYLSIGAGGIMSLERIIYKIPSIIVSTDKNQIGNCTYIQKNSFGIYLGNYKKLKFNFFKKVFNEMQNTKKFIEIRENCKIFSFENSVSNIIKKLLS